MRRFAVFGVVALLLLALTPLPGAGTTAATRHVDGSVVVSENADRTWLARFEVRTSVDDVQFGYLELYGIGGQVAGEIHEFTVYRVDYYKTTSGARGATLWTRECKIVPWPDGEHQTPCWDDGSTYKVTDGSSVGEDDTFLGWLGWSVTSGNISIYTTSEQGQQ